MLVLPRVLWQRLSFVTVSLHMIYNVHDTDLVRFTHLRSISRSLSYGWNLTHSRALQSWFFHYSFCDFYRAMLLRVRARLCHSMSSVCPSVTLRYVFHTGWNTSIIISRPNSLRYLLTFTPTLAIWSNGNTPKNRVDDGWGQEHKKPAISPKRCKIGPRSKVSMTD